MGVVRKIVNHIVDNVDPQISDATDHLPARFSGTFNDATRNLTMKIECQGASAEDLVATVNIPGGGGSGGPTYSAGNGINITPENAIEIDTAVTATKQSVDTLQAQVGDAFTEVAIGTDGKSLDFTALDGQVNNIALPGGSPSEGWILLNYLSEINETKVKIGSEIIIRCNIASDDTNVNGYFIEGHLICTYTTGGPVFKGNVIALKNNSKLILSEITYGIKNYTGVIINGIGANETETSFTFLNKKITNTPLYYLYIKY